MYVDCIYFKDKDICRIAERVDGKRVLKDVPVEYTFYYNDTNGRYTSMYGDRVSKFTTRNRKRFDQERRNIKSQGGHTYEYEIKPEMKMLEAMYKEGEMPDLNVCFFDIEVDFDKVNGYAPPEDPFNKITAISLYNNWEEVCHTLVLKPDEMSPETAVKICSHFDHTILCDDENDLLNRFLFLIDDADVLTGWNSSGFDIPYTINRIKRVLGKGHENRMCLWNQPPKARTFERFKKEQQTYDLVGRIHLDYLSDLYKKYTYHELPTYRLDYVGEIEVGERKVAYEGTLDQLYNYDFEKFIEYSRQDVMLMVKIDAKFDFITLVNQIAHDNLVRIQTVQGAVALTDNAIVREVHSHNMVVRDRVRKNTDVYDIYDKSWVDDKFLETEAKEDKVRETMHHMMGTIAGAFVVDPKQGLEDWIGSVDLNSLYPSVIRANSISNELIIGQIDDPETRKWQTDVVINEVEGKSNASMAHAWSGKFGTIEFEKVKAKTKDMLTVNFEDGTSINMRADEIHSMVYEQGHPICLSANGTLFKTDQQGIIPGLLARWYNERKEMKKTSEMFRDMSTGVKIVDEQLLKGLM